MSEEILGVPEFLVDCVTDVKIIDGVVRIPFHTKRDGETELVVRLAIPASELPDIIQAFVIVLANAVKSVIKPPLDS